MDVLPAVKECINRLEKSSLKNILYFVILFENEGVLIYETEI